MKIKLIDNWTDCWRFASVRTLGLGTAIPGLIELFPDQALHIWALLPEDMKRVVPDRYVLWYTLAVVAASFLARIIRQDKLHEKTD